MAWSILVLVGLLALAGCSSNPALSQKTVPKSSSPTPTPNGPEKKLPNLKDTLTTAGRTLITSKKGRPWMMEVLKIVWNDTQQTARIENVDWTLTDKKGRKMIRVQAPAAKYAPSENKIIFEGKVVATRFLAKDKIKVNHLEWDGKKSEFHGSQGVRWEKNKVVVTGDRLECPDTLETVHLEGKVEVTAPLEEGKFP